jgi:hypothetical protein
MRCSAASCACVLVPPAASATAKTSKPARRVSNAGKARQTSVNKAPVTSFLRPVASTAATKSASSHALMLVGSTQTASGSSSRSGGMVSGFSPA